jgi:hypothetical protein
MAINQKDAVAGAVFALTGGYFTLDAWFNLEMGSALRMGPGYYPLLVGLILVVLGSAIGLRALVSGPGPITSVNWRSLVLISVAPVIFGAMLPGLGLVPAVVASAFATSFASRRVSPLLAIGTSTGLAVFCVLIFVLGLGLPLRVIGPWLGGD